MKLTDLRIGNIIQYLCEDRLDERQKWHELNIVDWQDLKILSEREERLAKLPPPDPVKPDYIPMPLTEEWLLKCGAYRTREGCYQHRLLKGWVAKSKDEEGRYSYNYNIFHICDLKYVHQLQNLIYALTGEELEVSI